MADQLFDVCMIRDVESASESEMKLHRIGDYDMLWTEIPNFTWKLGNGMP